jgi:cation/acetate symporter
MVAGLAVTSYYMAIAQPWLRDALGLAGPVQLWWGIEPISAGVFGVPVGFAVIVAVSLLTRPPPAEVQSLVDDVRYPRGPAARLPASET